MNRQEFEARQLIGNWLAKQKISPKGKLRHVHPRCYVVHAASRVLIVARPWMDSEPQLQDFNRANPLDVVHTYDDSLKPGDWCATAYVITVNASEIVAVAWRE